MHVSSVFNSLVFCQCLQFKFIHWTQIDSDGKVHFLFVRDLEKFRSCWMKGVESRSDGVHRIHWKRIDSDGMFTICTNQFHLPKNDRGIKDGSEEMEHKFPLGTFRQEEQDHLFKCSVALGNFSLERPKKSCSIYFQTRFCGNLL